MNGAQSILHHLDVEGLLQEETSGNYQIINMQRLDFSRWEGITQQRYQELDQMEAFAASDECLMHFLARALEDPTHPEKCGLCKNCRKAQSKFVLDEAQLQLAQNFLLQGDPIMIEPRKQWVRRGVITPEAKLRHLNETGLALSYYNDEGWGKLVRHGKYVAGHFSDDLVEASASLILARWSGQIAWVTSVPSTRHPNLVPNFAQRLAHRLGLPYRQAVISAKVRPEQKTMQNSHLQLANIAEAFKIDANILRTPVLLVDDMIDSGWSLTLIGWMLRERGVSKVFPYVLSKAMGNTNT